MKPGYERTVYMGMPAIEALVATYGTPAAAVIMAPVIGAITYDLLHVCNSGDPGDPGLGPPDFVDAVDTSNIIAMGAAWRKIQQWFVHVMWPVWCNCADGTIPPPATSLPLPPATVNPGLPGGTTGPNCWDANGTKAWDTTTGWWFGHLLPQLGSPPQYGTDSYAPQLLPTPKPTSVQWTLHCDSAGNNALGFASWIQFWDVNGTILTNDSWTDGGQPVGSPPRTHWMNIPAAAAYLLVSGVPVGVGNPTNVAQGHVTLFCGGQTPSTPNTPCCPPDPLLDQRLTTIVGMLQQLANQVLVGNAGLVDADRHSGLSGSGTVTLRNACAAVRVEVTSNLGGWPNNPGSPNYYFSLGFITSVAVGAPLKGWRLVYSRQTFPLEAYADQVGYTLPPGVVVDLVEQLAGP
jgi:hypothetical protein